MEKLILQLGNVSCPVCADQVGTMLKKMKGVEDAKVFFSTSKAKLTYNPQEISAGEMIKAIERLGYSARVK